MEHHCKQLEPDCMLYFPIFAGKKLIEKKSMKRMILLWSFLVVTSWMYGQVTLEECRRKTQDNYPLVRQYSLIEKTKEYNLNNASKGNLPQFSLSAKASYQSDATELPVKIPGIDIKGLPKDQYQVMLELKQNIWDGGEIHSKKEMVLASSDVEREKLNVDMYALNERVDQIFFGILSLDEQLIQNRLLQEDLERSYRKISAYMENGIASQSDLDAVKVEQLNARQKRIELSSLRQAYLKMLSLLTGEELAEDTKLIKPLGGEYSPLNEIRRPELTWFDAQNNQLGIQEEALKVRHLPRLGVFVQGAYGNPGLNMLKDEFVPFYIAGVRLSWNFGSLYTLRNDKKVIAANRQQLQTNRDVFLFNTRLQATQQNSDIISMRKQMQDDEEIIRLRTNIRLAAEAKVANGTLTVTDMLREITSENMARQTKALHEVQLLMNIWKLKFTVNGE